ncbi:hypothetical protein ACFL3C_01490 [Patescibacteria group bacterium]
MSEERPEDSFGCTEFGWLKIRELDDERYEKDDIPETSEEFLELIREMNALEAHLDAYDSEDINAGRQLMFVRRHFHRVLEEKPEIALQVIGELEKKIQSSTSDEDPFRWSSSSPLDLVRYVRLSPILKDNVRVWGLLEPIANNVNDYYESRDASDIPSSIPIERVCEAIQSFTELYPDHILAADTLEMMECVLASYMIAEASVVTSEADETRKRIEQLLGLAGEASSRSFNSNLDVTLERGFLREVEREVGLPVLSMAVSNDVLHRKAIKEYVLYLIEAGDSKRASEICAEILNEDPDSVLGQTLYVRIFLGRGTELIPEEMRDLYTRLGLMLLKESLNPEIYYLLGLLDLKNLENDEQARSNVLLNIGHIDRCDPEDKLGYGKLLIEAFQHVSN